MWLVCIAMVLGAENEYSIDELRAAYEQNRSAFSLLYVEVEWNQSIPAETSDNIQNHISFAEQKLASLINRQKLYEFLKTNKHPGWESLDPRDEKAFIAAVTKDMRADTKPPDIQERYIFVQQADGIEVRRAVDSDNPRRAAAAEEKIASFTGSDYIVAQSGADNRWTALDPYPFKGRHEASAWRRSALPVAGMVPPFIEENRLKGELHCYLSQLWDRQNEMKSFGIISLGSEQVQLIVASSKIKRDLLLASIAVSERASISVPRWISLCNYVKDGNYTTGQIGDLSSDNIFELAKQIDHLYSQPSSEACDFARPQVAVYFSSVEKVNGAGCYPRLVRWLRFGNYRPKDALQTNPKDLPIGWSEIGKLDVRAIQVGTEVPAIVPLQLPDKTIFLDIDTNVASVFGEDVSAPNMSTNRFRLPLVYVSIAATLVIIVAVFLRRRFSGASE